MTSKRDPCFTPQFFISWKNKITCLGLTLIMTLFTQIVLDIQIWVSFELILEWHQNGGLGMDHIINLNVWSSKWITNLKKTVIQFDLFITVGIEYTNMAPFWLNLPLWSHKDCLISKFWKKWWKIKFFTSKNTHDSKFRTFYYCLVAIYSSETALKNLGKRHQRGTPVSHHRFWQVETCS